MLRSASIASSLAALCLALAPAATAAVRPGSVYGPASANRALAHREVRRLLRSLRLPSDAQRTSLAALGTHGRLSVVPGGRGEAHLADAHSFWRSYDGPGVVLSYVAHHLPAGVEFSTRTAGGGTNGVGYLSWRLHAPAGLAMREVAVSAVSIAPGLTAVRLDAEAQWLRPRPDWERIPSGVALATTAGHGARQGEPSMAAPESRIETVGTRAARRLAGWINRQPVLEPRTFFSCPLGANQLLGVSFIGADGRLLAQATESFAGGCGSLTLTVGGRRGPALEDSGLEQELVRLHALPTCTRHDLSALPPVRGRTSGGPSLTFALRDTSSAICTATPIPSIALIGTGGHVLVGRDLHAPPGPATVLYPDTGEAVVAEFQSCPSRPPVTSARLRLSPRIAWTLPLQQRRRVHPCAEPLTLVPDGTAAADGGDGPASTAVPTR